MVVQLASVLAGFVVPRLGDNVFSFVSRLQSKENRVKKYFFNLIIYVINLLGLAGTMRRPAIRSDQVAASYAVLPSKGILAKGYLLKKQKILVVNKCITISQVYITSIAVLPIRLVSRAVTENNVQYNQSSKERTANADRNVERRIITNEWVCLEWIVQVFRTLFDCSHVNLCRSFGVGARRKIYTYIIFNM